MKCSTEGCVNEVVFQRRFCDTCRKRKYREKYPLKYYYDTLKNNAKRRGKEFTLTLEEFIDFCKETNYDKLKGKTALSMSIDRRWPCHGYHKWNIRSIMLAENTRRRFEDEDETECPF